MIPATLLLILWFAIVDIFQIGQKGAPRIISLAISLALLGIWIGSIVVVK